MHNVVCYIILLLISYDGQSIYKNAVTHTHTHSTENDGTATSKSQSSETFGYVLIASPERYFVDVHFSSAFYFRLLRMNQFARPNVLQRFRKFIFPFGSARSSDQATGAHTL